MKLEKFTDEQLDSLLHRVEIEKQRRCPEWKPKTIKGLKGWRITKSGKYEARIKMGGSEYHLGTFDDQITAEIAYDVAKRNYLRD